jgi:hypothetical protein
MEVKNLYNKNYETLSKKIEEDTRGWKDLPCSWINSINIIKKDYIIKSNLQIQYNLHQISNVIFQRNRTHMER